MCIGRELKTRGQGDKYKNSVATVSLAGMGKGTFYPEVEWDVFIIF